MPSPGARSRRARAAADVGPRRQRPRGPDRRAGAGDSRRERLVRVLDALDAAVDAAADAVNAESAYQLVRGNLARAATLDDVAGGHAPPPRPRAVRTPRTGTPSPTGSPSCSTPQRGSTPRAGGRSASPRAEADPRLDAWAAALLGPATGVDVVVAELDGGGAEVTRHHVALTALGLTPIDLVWIAATPASPPSSPSGRSPRRPPPTSAPRRPACASCSSRPPTAAPAISATCSRWPRGAPPARRDPTPRRRRPAAAARRPRPARRPRRARIVDRRRPAGARSRARHAAAALLDDPSPTVGAMRRALVAAAGFGIATGLAPLAGGDADVMSAVRPASVGERRARRRHPSAGRCRARATGPGGRARGGAT